MKWTYDRKVEAGYVDLLSGNSVAKSLELIQGPDATHSVFVDYDIQGVIVGIEIS